MMTLIGMFAFMLIPIWIPVVAVSIGYVGDIFRRPSPTRVHAAKAPSAAWSADAA